MKRNVGGWDRSLRYVVGAGALAFALFGRARTPQRMGSLALAATALVTATTRYCPVNDKLEINTFPKRKGRLRKITAPADAPRRVATAVAQKAGI